MYFVHLSGTHSRKKNCNFHHNLEINHLEFHKLLFLKFHINCCLKSYLSKGCLTIRAENRKIIEMKKNRNVIIMMQVNDQN